MPASWSVPCNAYGAWTNKKLRWEPTEQHTETSSKNSEVGDAQM